MSCSHMATLGIPDVSKTFFESYHTLTPVVVMWFLVLVELVYVLANTNLKLRKKLGTFVIILYILRNCKTG